MRVTKLIKNYVEEQVEKRFPQSQAEIKRDEICEKIAKKEAELDEKIDKIAEELCEQANKELGFGDLKSEQGFYVRKYHCSIITSSPCGIKIYEEAQTEEKKRIEKIKNTINNILISLELGANRQELEEMLNNIGVNQNEDKI